MSQAKIEFIQSMQEEEQALWPYDVSQRIREKFAWLCLYRGDSELDPKLAYRGYMVRPSTSRAHSAEDPAAYWCVVATSQTMGWQNLVWIKEMLQGLDSEDALTSDAEKLDQVIAMSDVHEPNGHDTPPNVVADRNGFTLALGCAIPQKLRDALRRELIATGGLSPLRRADLENYIPSEYVDHVLDEAFEQEFDNALKEIA